MTETAATPDVLAMVEDASGEWKARQGRPRGGTVSPYLPLIEKSVADAGDDFTKNGGKPLGMTLTLNGKTDEERKADLGKHVNALRKAGRQHDPAVSVLVQAGDIVKGSCRVLFKARPKITRTGSTKTATATPTAA